MRESLVRLDEKEAGGNKESFRCHNEQKRWSQTDLYLNSSSSSVIVSQPHNSFDPVSSPVKWECAEYLLRRVVLRITRADTCDASAQGLACSVEEHHGAAVLCTLPGGPTLAIHQAS